MILKFKVQPYQTSAVESVVNCFAGQVAVQGIRYRIDPGVNKIQNVEQMSSLEKTGFKNADLQLSDHQLVDNIQSVQRAQNLPQSEKLFNAAGCNINLAIEMETGTGKTYCYIKTIFELHKRYGWGKFIIMVPSIAIREGIYKSFEITASHFAEYYGKKVRFFIYNSRQLHQLESFSSDAGINVMIINVQAFNATGADNRRIYDELDDFQTRRPIDVISSNRPIVILDEPQKMEGAKTLESIARFKPLMILRYSATHKTDCNKIHRLDALDAYNQKLVKKIAVRGISVKGLSGTTAYLYLESIEISKKAPVARIEIEVKTGTGIKRMVRILEKRSNLFDESGGLDQYNDYVISQIDYTTDTVEFTNGQKIVAGEAVGDVNEMAMRRIQIRETIKAHFDKEKQLFSQGIKVLSLFFIDEVVKYRDYSQADEKGEYAHIFEEEYEILKNEYLSELALDNVEYRKYIDRINVIQTHNGYFSIDKKTKRLKDPEVGKKSVDSDDVDAYDLILKDKERLLSFDEPVRFIFSHSALREGWDNPNVFVMCMLKHSDNTISRRQEVGRGLRLSVNQFGERQDNPSTVHTINVLTVVASESYKDFVANLQKEIYQSLSERARVADKAFFVDKTIITEQGNLNITEDMAESIEFYLIQNGYVDKKRTITEKYHADKKSGNLAMLPDDLKPHKEQIISLVNSVFDDSQMPPLPEDSRRNKNNPLNSNYDKKEFKELWNRINKKSVYKVDFDTTELIRNCINVLNQDLRVRPLQYTTQAGIQAEYISDKDLKQGDGFILQSTVMETHNASIHSMVPYDLLGKIAENTKLTRKTIATILTSMQVPVFNQFKQNPEHFIAEVSRLINEQKATVIIEHLTYNTIAETYTTDIFTAEQTKQDFSRATEKLTKHIYDYVIVDSNIERDFVRELDTCTDVVVYAKLPGGFFIPTPVGDYNPDWAISFKEGNVKHIYFIAETKGDLSSTEFNAFSELRVIEESKIKCARKFFEELNRKINPDNVKYDVVQNLGQLMEIVGKSS
jgi:type III restriction enzyme